MTDVRHLAAQITAMSAFRPGGPHGFAVPLSPPDVVLPGACDPFVYTDVLRRRFPGTNIQGARVLVLGAGYCGLGAAALHRGAKEVVCVESHYWYREPAARIAAALDKLFPGRCKFYGGRLRDGVDLGTFDLILVPDGLEHDTTPLATLAAATKLLAPGGRLVVEIHHGDVEAVREPVNCFQPTEACWTEIVRSLLAVDVPLPIKGRLAGRRIYCFALGGEAPATVPPEPAPAPEEPPAPAPDVEPDFIVYDDEIEPDWPEADQDPEEAAE